MCFLFSCFMLQFRIYILEGERVYGGKGWCEGVNLRIYREFRCRGRGGFGCCFQYRCWVLGLVFYSVGCGFGFRFQCTCFIQIIAISFLWVVGWDEVKCFRIFWWGLEGLLVFFSFGQMYLVFGQVCVVYSVFFVCSSRQMFLFGEGVGLVQERVR